MPTLKETLLTPAKRAQVVQDTVRLIDDEVKSKGGLVGLAVKAAYGMVNKLKPSIISETVDGLLDRFVDRLEPFFASWSSAGKTDSFERFLVGQKNQVANALLSVTDDRARVVQNATLRKAYESLRPQGEKHVEAAIPGLGRLLSKYV